MPQDIAPPPTHSYQLDASALEAALRRHLRGEVRFDSGTRAMRKSNLAATHWLSPSACREAAGLYSYFLCSATVPLKTQLMQFATVSPSPVIMRNIMMFHVIGNQQA